MVGAVQMGAIVRDILEIVATSALDIDIENDVVALNAAFAEVGNFTGSRAYVALLS